MSIIKQYVIQYKTIYIQSVSLAVLSVLCSLLTYVALAAIVVGLVEGVAELTYYVPYCLLILVGMILKEVFSAISTSLSHKATFYSLKGMRKQLTNKLFTLPLGNTMNISSGTLKNIIVDQVDAMENTLAHVIPEMTANLVGPLLLFIYMLILDYRLALLSLVPFVIGMFCMKSVMGSYGKKYQQSVAINQKMNNAVVEYINGIEVIKMFNQSEQSYKKYGDAVHDNASFYYQWMKECMLGMSMYKKISPMSLLTILPFGLYFYNNDSLTLSAFITIIVISFGTIENILSATNFVDDLSRIGTVTKEIEDILDAKELHHSTTPVQFSEYDISFNNVGFSYDETTKILNDVSLTIPAHKITAFVGQSGSGKSTMAKLIAGFWEPESGEMRIGGHKLSDIPLDQLAETIAYVSQDNYLFDISVRDNIRIGKPNATDAEVENMAKLAGCSEFINNLSHGFDTLVGEGGGHLSGGERQRISIARAMLKDAPIVMLDEATSYIDTENESIIQTAISNLVSGKTLVLIAHRLRTIVDADQIFVVDKGCIDSSGTHQELLATSSLYQNMWQSASKEG